MIRFLPLVLLLAACGDDPAPAVVSDTDVAVVAPPTDAPPTDAPATDDAAEAMPADASEAAPAPASAPAATPVPPALAALPGETAYYKDGQEEVVIFQTGATPMSGELIYTPHPDLDQIYDKWSIKGNTLTFMGTTYTFDAADGAGTYQFQGPQGEMVLTIAAG